MEETQVFYKTFKYAYVHVRICSCGINNNNSIIKRIFYLTSSIYTHAHIHILSLEHAGQIMRTFCRFLFLLKFLSKAVVIQHSSNSFCFSINDTKRNSRRWSIKSFKKDNNIDNNIIIFTRFPLDATHVPHTHMHPSGSQSNKYFWKKIHEL